MLDDLREWISDNLRYILLGAAVILVIVIAVVAVRLIRGGSSSSGGSEPSTQKVTENSLQQETEDGAENGADAGQNTGTGTSSSSKLVKDEPAILELMTSYYNARADKDYDAMADLCEVFDDSTRQEVESRDVAIEAYNNIMTYSKAGMTEGSYVVYVYFDAKVTGIDTLAPSLREWYLITDSDGNLVIANQEGDSELQAFIESMRTDEDVQALRQDVDQKLQAAEAQDEDLKNFVESGTTDSSGSQDSGENTGDGGGESNGTSTGSTTVSTAVNVRGEPDASSTLYGTLYEGTSVEVLENLDSGWSRIRYTADGTTIEGYVMTQYLSNVQ